MRQYGLDLPRFRFGPFPWRRWDRYRFRRGWRRPYVDAGAEVPCSTFESLFDPSCVPVPPEAPPGGPEQEQAGESLGAPAGGGEGCPSILGRMAWVGQDGLAVSQFQGAGAPLSRDREFSFWFYNGLVYQFRVRASDFAVWARKCFPVAEASVVSGQVAALNALTPQEVRERGYG